MYEENNYLIIIIVIRSYRKNNNQFSLTYPNFMAKENAMISGNTYKHNMKSIIAFELKKNLDKQFIYFLILINSFFFLFF